MPPLSVRIKNWGPNDTLIVAALWYRNEMHTFREQEGVWIGRGSAAKQAKQIKEWTRLRNAVYVTYPYARIAGNTINDIQRNLAGILEKRSRKKFLESRENELRTQFADPLTNLSVYQGKILMKLINRETSNTCYELVKEYKGGFSAKFWQTIAWVFGGSLKQNYDPKGEDAEIEQIVLEVARMYGHAS